jgi:hypothetical protein
MRPCSLILEDGSFIESREGIRQAAYYSALFSWTFVSAWLRRDLTWRLTTLRSLTTFAYS